MYFIALRMLFNDRSKYLLLLFSLTFSTLLMVQQSAIFLGLMRFGTAMLRNSRAPIWVVDPKVEQVNESKPLRGTELYLVRSVDGVEWAMPIMFSIIQARLPSGRFKQVQLIGLDSSTLAGLPVNITAGNPADLFQDKAVVIDQEAITKFTEEDSPRPFGMGDTFEINDHELRVVALCRADPSFFGYPYVYTTYDRARDIIPPQRNYLSYIIVQPKPGIDPDVIARRIEMATGLNAYTEDEFSKDTIIWFFKNTGIPIAFGTTVILGFLVGIAVAGQTFYTFIIENTPNFGALKAMGVTNFKLLTMMIVQAIVVGIMGYGFGLGLSGLFGLTLCQNGHPPFYLSSYLLLGSFICIMTICIFSVTLGMRRIASIEPAQVFRT